MFLEVVVASHGTGKSSLRVQLYPDSPGVAVADGAGSGKVSFSDSATAFNDERGVRWRGDPLGEFTGVPVPTAIPALVGR